MVQFFTERQSRVLAFLRTYLQAEGKAPTLAELATHLQVSKITALQHLRALERKGAIRRQRHAWRSIEILGPESADGGRVTTLPIRGELGPGGELHYGATTAAASGAGSGDFDVVSLVPAERHGHVVRVVGDDAATHDFRDGDLLVIEPRGTPRDGELVMARVGATTVSFGRFRAGADGEGFEPLRGPDRSGRRALASLRVLGVVRAAIRSFVPTAAKPTAE